jgi:cyclase
MKKVRIIPRLDIKNDTVVKGVHLEGLRVVGKPGEMACEYYKQGADEILYMDAVASLYERNSLVEIVKKAAKRIFVPLTVGGGIRKLEDISEILNSGADKVAINTAAIRNPEFIREASVKFGSQCIVLSVEAKKTSSGWIAYTETGREPSKYNILEWIPKAIKLGAGEVLLTSVDTDGTKRGFDMDLIKAVASICSVPLIVSGGAKSLEDILTVFKSVSIEAAAVGTGLHYEHFTINQVKTLLGRHQIKVRH